MLEQSIWMILKSLLDNTLMILIIFVKTMNYTTQIKNGK